MRRLLLIVAVLLVLAVPVSAGRGTITPDVAEIEDFRYDQCANVFSWTTTSEIIITGYRLENHQANWFSPYINAANYGSNRPASYALYGPMDGDHSGDFLLRVYFDYGTSRAEDYAERVCEWSPPWVNIPPAQRR